MTLSILGCIVRRQMGWTTTEVLLKYLFIQNVVFLDSILAV